MSLAARFFIILSFVFSSLVSSAVAQDAGRTILVLDASGSMWGQIEGRTKIEIAQEVVGDLLETLPQDQHLGLTAYGHRRKGDCSDIESLVAPAANSRTSILAAVNAITPKGKTPLSAAVLAAAEELKYTEEAATVILVSDGRETCDFDPCEVGRRLEDAGVNFTAHVVGFDVAKKADLAQLQCLAENTGGQFLTASNATELALALKAVAKPVVPQDARLRFDAVEGDGGSTIVSGLIWSMTNTETGETLQDNAAVDHLDIVVKPGVYRAEVLRIIDEATAELTVTISAGGQQNFHLTLPVYTAAATVDGPQSAVAGSTISVDWSGPNEDGDFLTVAVEGTASGKYITYSYTRDGDPSSLLAPPVPGSYEIRYIQAAGTRQLASIPITVTPVTATIDAPVQAVAGQTLMLPWSGPNYQGDFLTVAEVGSKDSKYVNYSYTAAGAPLGLVMPPWPGDYEVRYVMAQRNTVIVRYPVTVTEVAARLEAPAQTAAGGAFPVGWTGPSYDGDFLTVAEVGSPDSQYLTFAYTANGPPTSLQAPATPGSYELRYVMNQRSRVIARQPLELVPATSSLTAPSTANVGEPVLVDWTGPNNAGDYLTMAEVGSRDSDYISYVYTSGGSPLRVAMPLVPGTYELRYVLDQDTKVIERHTIEVVALDVSVTPRGTAQIGGPLVVDWTGPGYERDYISIAEVGSRDTAYIHYAYTNDGTPLRLPMPPMPGEYELRYMASGPSDTKLAGTIITVEAVNATLAADDSADAGAQLLVTWTGPGFDGDYITITTADRDYVTYQYAQSGSPVLIPVPDAPGAYELRYVLGVGDTVIASQALTVR